MFRTIEKYERYGVNELGEVKNLETGRILKARDNGLGYYQVKLYKKGKGKNFYVHHLVARAFLEKKDGCDVITHLDGNPQNNRVENLEWTKRK